MSQSGSHIMVLLFVYLRLRHTLTVTAQVDGGTVRDKLQVCSEAMHGGLQAV